MQSGIYKIRHIESGKIYIGSSKDINTRWQQHRRALIRGDHRNTHLQRAWNKYGENEFAFEIIENTESGSLIEREQYYIDLFNVTDNLTGYNIAPIAGNSLGIKRSDITKERVRQARLGTILTSEHKENISKGVSGSKKYRAAITSSEYKEKMRQANLGNKNPMFGKYGKAHPKSIQVIQYTKDNVFVKEWDSLAEAAKALKISHANISSCCSGRVKTAYGFVWKYKEEG